MPATLLLAPAAYGKTAHALARIRTIRAERGGTSGGDTSGRPLLAPITVVLPNQIQLAAFENRLAAQGGALGVSLFSFYGLYAELLARAGQPIPRLDDLAQVRLIRAMVDDLAERGRLAHFAPLRVRPGFPIALREAFEELKQARIRAEDFTPAVRGLGQRLEELAEIYSAYQGWLQEKNWADPEGQGWLAAIALEQNQQLGRDFHLLVVDGFDEFNPTQLAVLAHLAGRAHETLVTLTGDPQRHRLAHRRFQCAERQLLAKLQPEVSYLAAEPETEPQTQLDYVEMRLFEPFPCPDVAFPSGRPEGGSEVRQIEFLKAQTRAVEARAALRWVKQRLVEDGLALGEVAVLTRSLDPYRVFLDEAAREFGLPLWIVGGAPLAENPVVSSLLTLLSLPAEGWRPRALLQTWRSPYFDWPALGLDLKYAAVLDAVSRLGRVVEGLDQWREALARSPGALRDDEPEGDLSRPSPDEVTAASAAFESLVARMTPPSRAGLRDYVAFLEDLIGDDPAPPVPGFGVGVTLAAAPRALNVVARALAGAGTAPRDIAALRTLKEVLRSLVLTESLINTPLSLGAAHGSGAAANWDYGAFISALREAVEAATYRTPLSQFGTPGGRAGGEGPGVTVASVLDARGLSFRAVAILGLAEGEFPQAEHEMPLLREADRAALGERGLPLESRLRGDEVTIFYEAVTRARERLLLCRPYLADDGQQWEPSSYWRQVSRLLGKPSPLNARPEDRLPREQVASETEWIEQGYDLSAIASGVAALRARLAAEARGAHEGELPELSPAIAALYPADVSWSASRLEAYGTCAFYFYVAYLLNLEPRAEPEEGYDVRELGNMYHVILERLYRDAAEPTDLDGLLARLPDVARAVFATAPSDYGFRPTAIWQQQQAELLRVLGDTVTALAAKSEGWTPRYFEQRFGFGAPPLVVRTAEGEVRLHGYIDRIDVDAAGRLRVVDYKASGTPITANDLKDGHRLQLPLYALAARDALKLGEVAEGFYWHIGRAEASSLKLDRFDGGVAGAFETVKRHLAAHVAGIRAGQFQPRPPEGGCPRYCPAIGFCWRYRPKGI